MTHRGTASDAGEIDCRQTACGIVAYCIAVLALLLAFEANAAAKQPPAHPLDLNTATIEELQQLPGVGPGIAKAIAQFREKSGPFKRVEELLAIRGISQQKFEKIRPYVFVRTPRKKTGS